MLLAFASSLDIEIPVRSKLYHCGCDSYERNHLAVHLPPNVTEYTKYYITQQDFSSYLLSVYTVEV